VKTLRGLHFIALMLTMASIFVASNIYTFIPIYEQVANTFQVPEKQVVFAGSVFTIFYAIGLLLFGGISDLIGERTIIVWGMFFAAIASLLLAISQNIEFLMIARAIQGLSLASFAPMAFAYTFNLFHGKTRTFLLVLINTGYLVAGIWGQLTSSFISQDMYLFFFRLVIFYFSVSYRRFSQSLYQTTQIQEINPLPICVFFISMGCYVVMLLPFPCYSLVLPSMISLNDLSKMLKCFD
jgi:MFS family permease